MDLHRRGERTTLGERWGWENSPIGPFHDDIVLDRTSHVPLLVWGLRAAGITRQIDQPVELVDILPTFASLAGGMLPAGLQGQVLTATPFQEDPDAVAWVEFGDVLADPWQKHDLALEEPWLAAEMRQIMIRIRSGPAAPDEEAARPDRLWELRMTQSQGYW